MFFLGGCTYTEIAALRWVGRQNRGIPNYFTCLTLPLTTNLCTGRNFLIATTGIISGANIIEGIAGVGQSSGSKGVMATV